MAESRVEVEHEGVRRYIYRPIIGLESQLGANTCSFGPGTSTPHGGFAHSRFGVPARMSAILISTYFRNQTPRDNSRKTSTWISAGEISSSYI